MGPMTHVHTLAPLTDDPFAENKGSSVKIERNISDLLYYSLEEWCETTCKKELLHGWIKGQPDNFIF